MSSRKPAVNKEKFVSSIWLIVSVVIIFIGFLHCRVYSFDYEMNCDVKMCKLSGTSQNTLHIPRADLLSVEITEIPNVISIDGPNKISRTLRFYLNLPAEPGSRFKVKKNVLFTPHDMGEKYSQTAYQSAQQYMKADANRKEALLLSNSQSTTTIGIISMVIGAVSALLSLILGQWSQHKIDYNRKTH